MDSLLGVRGVSDIPLGVTVYPNGVHGDFVGRPVLVLQ